MARRNVVPPAHPRAESLRVREQLVTGFRNGLVAAEGLIAHGRGEAFDYLLGERTSAAARRAIKAAAALLLSSSRPVISVNGNLAALCAPEVVRLAKLTGASIEVNLFYRTAERELAIKNRLIKSGAATVLGVGRAASATIPELQSERRRVDPEGIYAADTVFVPLEDGDRTEALVRLGKKVITIDLNPLSRTSTAAHISIVDNVTRAIPALLESVASLRGGRNLESIVDRFDNSANLARSLKIIRSGI